MYFASTIEKTKNENKENVKSLHTIFETVLINAPVWLWAVIVQFKINKRKKSTEYFRKGFKTEFTPLAMSKQN